MLPRSIVLTLALATLVAGCVSPAPTTPPAEGPDAPRAPADGEPLAGMAGFVNADPTGRTGAGGPALAHRDGALLAGAAGEVVPRLYQTGASALEPTIGIAPDGTLYTTMLMRRVTGPVFTSPPTVLRSTDEGVSWQIVFQDHGMTQDPYTHVDAATGRVFTVDFVGCNLVSFSDNGEDWTTAGGAACGWVNDHQTIFSGPAVTSATQGFDAMTYLCGIGGGAVASAGTLVTCAKSADGGLTWLPTGEPAFSHMIGLLRSQTRDGAPGCYAGNGHGFVGADGTVYVPRGHCDQPWLAMSKDEGATWTRVQVADNGMPTSPTLVEHEASVIADAAGNIYYFWVAADWLPYLSVSRDGGATWSPPHMVAPPGVTAAALPALAIGEGDNLALAYMGTTNASDEATWWSGYLSLTFDALSLAPTFTTASVNDPADPLVVGACGPLRCQSQFDFLDVQVAPDGRAWMALADGCDGPDKCVATGRGIVATLDGAPSLRAP